MSQATAPRMKPAYRPALEVPALTHEEAYRMALAELEKLIGLLEQLDEEDWSKPTACALWDVRQMVAHLAGAAEGYLSFKNFRRQLASRELKPYHRRGLRGIDAINQLQVDDRVDRTPAELIAELKSSGPQAIRNRYKLPRPLRAVRLTLPLLGYRRVDYLTDTIYTRDMWMHRLDICQATGREMELEPRHDGRMTALVVRDLAERHARRLNGRQVIYRLTGPAGGAWSVGLAAEPDATLEMDALDFHLLAADRLKPGEALDEGRVKISGDSETGHLALAITQVPY